MMQPQPLAWFLAEVNALNTLADAARWEDFTPAYTQFEGYLQQLPAMSNTWSSSDRERIPALLEQLQTLSAKVAAKMQSIEGDLSSLMVEKKLSRKYDLNSEG